MSTRTMKAPSTIGAGSKVALPDGTSTSVDAGGNVTIDDKFVGDLLGGGFTLFPLATAGQILRRRCTAAEINAGVELLPALPGFKYRLQDAAQIAIGGAAGTTTTVDVLGTQTASSVKLLAVAIAALTRSALVRAGAANATILADGASFAACDANTAITAGKTGGSLDTATHIDVLLSYVIEPA